MTDKTQCAQPAPLSETVAAAMRKAFNLGQTYFQQADSESYSQNAKSDITRSKFDALLEETTAAVAESAPAPLIAAAPELLSLLIEATDDYAAHCEGGEADEWVQFARAAIAKATGAQA